MAPSDGPRGKFLAGRARCQAEAGMYMPIGTARTDRERRLRCEGTAVRIYETPRRRV